MDEIRIFLLSLSSKWFRGRVARQWSAKPSTAVRIRSEPPKSLSEIRKTFLLQISSN